MKNNFRTLISGVLAKVSSLYAKKEDVYTKNEAASKEDLATLAKHDHSYLHYRNYKIKLPHISDWRSLTYGNGKFVAISYNSNKVVYSEDGINWIETKLPSISNWISLTYGNGKFVAISYNSDKIVYSEDGINWIETKMISFGNWKSLTYGNGKFVAVSYNSDRVAYSEDGINWNETKLTSISSFDAVTYGNGKFVAISYNSDKVFYSEDGINWVEILTTMPSLRSWVSLVYGNDKFVAISNNYNTVTYSEDGINWFYSNLPYPRPWTSLTYGNGKFVAVVSGNDKVFYSDDGINWVETTLSYDYSWKSVTYGDKKFVALSSNTNEVAYSYDGITWYYTYNEFTQKGEVVSIATADYVDGVISAVPTKVSQLINDTLTAENYVTNDVLTAKNYVTNDELDSKGYATSGSVENSINEAKEDIKESVDKKQDILNFNTDYDGSTNKAATMSDIADGVKPCIQLDRATIERPYSGTTITVVDDKIFAPVVDHYADNAHGVMAYSEDGLYWEVMDTLPADYMWSDIAYGNGIYVAIASVAFAEGSGAIARSVDGKSWELYTTLPDWTASDGLGASLGRIVFIKNLFILVTKRFSLYYSYDGIEWVHYKLQGYTYFEQPPVLYNDKIFFSVSAGVYSSEDGKTWSFKQMNNANNVSYVTLRVLGDEMYARYRDTNSIYRMFKYVNDSWVEVNGLDVSFFDLKRTAYGNGLYVTFVQSDEHDEYFVPYYSADMITWTKGTISSEFGLRSGRLGYDAPDSMVYHNGRFVTCSRSSYNDDTYAYSDDGINWFTTRPALVNDDKDMTWELSSLLSGKMFGQFATKDYIKEYVEQTLLGGAW